MSRARLSLILSVLAVVTIVAGVSLYYTPPLVREKSDNLVLRGVDLVGFSWHHNRAFWFEAVGNKQKARCEYLFSAWYRPAFFPKYTGGSQALEDISFQLQECQSYRKAAVVLQKATLSADSTPDDWSNVASLYFDAGDYSGAIEALETAILGGVQTAEILGYAGRAYEKKGQLTSALRYYRQAVLLDESNFRSLAGLERLGTHEERGNASLKLSKLATTEVLPENLTGPKGGLYGGSWAQWTTGSARAQVNLLAGDANASVSARGSFAGSQWPLMTVALARQTGVTSSVPTDSWKVFEFELYVPETDRYTLRVHFLNDFTDAETGEDRNLFINKISFVRP